MRLYYLILKGSAKLEKAEILQMTVDHLKMLQATGGKGKVWYHLSPPFYLSLFFLSLEYHKEVTVEQPSDKLS
jgi:hypothetical protein